MIVKLDDCLALRRVIVKLGASVAASPDTFYGLHVLLGDQRTIAQ